MQMGYNQQAQQGSMVGQANPFGGMQYVQTGVGANGTPLYTSITSLSPQQQALLNRQVQTQLLAGSEAAPMLAGGLYGSVPPSVAIGDMASGLTGQMMGQEVNYLEPFFNLQKQQEQAQLANQGFTPGTTAYNNAMMPFETSQNLDVSNFLAQAFPQAYQMSAGTYQLPMNMAQQLAAWGAPQMPGGQFVQTPQLGAPNLMGAYSTAQTAAEQAYQAQLAQQQNMMSGLFGIGSAGLGALGQYGAMSALAAAI